MGLGISPKAKPEVMATSNAADAASSLVLDSCTRNSRLRLVRGFMDLSLLEHSRSVQLSNTDRHSFATSSALDYARAALSIRFAAVSERLSRPGSTALGRPWPLAAEWVPGTSLCHRYIQTRQSQL